MIIYMHMLYTIIHWPDQGKPAVFVHAQGQILCNNLSFVHRSMGEVRQEACVVIVVAFITKVCSVKGSYSHNKLIISTKVNYFTTELTVHQYLFINIKQLDALNFIISLFQPCTCYEYMCSSSGGQNCILQSLVSSHIQVAVPCTD